MLSSLNTADKGGNPLIYELIKCVAFYIHRDKKYIDEYKELLNNSILTKHINVAIANLKAKGYIYNVDKDGIPIWNPRANSKMSEYVSASSKLVDEFIKLWGNRKRYMNNRLQPTLHIQRVTVALDEFKKKYEVNDARILSATKEYLSEFELLNGGYKGLSNADNFIAQNLYSYTLEKVTSSRGAGYNEGGYKSI